MKIVILGAGISGLALGFFLKKKYGASLDLTILEKSPHAGGWIKTLKKENFLFELGPRSCRTTGSGMQTLQLIEDLGLQMEIITADASAKKRFIYLNQKLKPFPSGILSFFISPLTRGLFKPLCRDFFGFSCARNEESIHEFSSRKLGVKAANWLFDPLTSGIYAGDTRKLSLKACFPYLYDLEFMHGSLLRGMIFNKNKIVSSSAFVNCFQKSSLISFKSGMQTLTDALAANLKQHILYGANALQVECLENRAKVDVEGRDMIEADYIFSTISAKQLANLIPPSELKKCLSNFKSTSVASVSLGFKENVLKERGFGFLVPSNQSQEILGTVFDSMVFKEQNRLPDETRLTVMMGGAHMAHFDELSENDFLDMAARAISKILKIDASPDVSHICIAKNAIPQYLIGHLNRVDHVKELSPTRLKILGASFFGVSVNDCIASAKLHAG